MTYEEVLNGITGAMKNPDTMETSIKPILEGIKTDYEGFSSTSAELEKANARIRDLQDTNHKLFLSQVGTPEKTPDDIEKPTGAGVLTEFRETINNISNNKERENG